MTLATEDRAEADPGDERPGPGLVLECALDAPDALRSLLRHPLLAAGLPKPVRWKAESVTWLEAKGLGEDVLLRQGRRGAPEPVFCVPPAGEVWLPGELRAPPAWEPEGAAPPRALAAFVGRRLALSAGDVGVAILHGRLRAIGGEAPVQRVELSGPPEEVLALGAALAEQLPLLPAPVTLAEAARATAHATAPRPRREGAPRLGDAATVEAGFRAAAAHLLDALLAEVPRCRLAAGPRGVHQARVALRRLRSALKLFRGAVDGPELRAWNAGLADLAKALGEARDWDVFQAGTVAPLRHALPEERGLARLEAAARAKQEEAYAALEARLGGAAFRALVWRGLALCAGIAAPEEGDGAKPREALRPFAARLIERRWKRVRKAGKAADRLDPAALHALRLDVKRLRYAVELFRPLWGGKAPSRLLRGLAAAQDSLGLANDAEVARALAASLAAVPPFAAGAVAGFSAGRAEGSREAFLEDWERVLDAKRFWKSELAAKPE